MKFYNSTTIFVAFDNNNGYVDVTAVIELTRRWAVHCDAFYRLILWAHVRDSHKSNHSTALHFVNKVNARVNIFWN